MHKSFGKKIYNRYDNIDARNAELNEKTMKKQGISALPHAARVRSRMVIPLGQDTVQGFRTYLFSKLVPIVA